MPNYKIPDAMRLQVEEQITKMLQLGIIEENNSPYCSPLVVVKKRDGSIRLCVNNIGLNERIESDLNGLDDPREILAKVAGGRYISTIDIRRAY